MLKRMQGLPLRQRMLVFVLFFSGALLALIAITVFLILTSLNAAPRQVATVLHPGVAVQEFVTLPDDNSYPAAVAVSPDGTVYTGSYDTGAVWAISPDGVINEIPETRERIGAVTGLTVAADSTLYVLDRIDSNPRVSGGVIWQIAPDGTLRAFASALDTRTDFVSPVDIALDSAGRIYVIDRGRREVWRFDERGIGEIWWFVDADDDRARDVIPTGLTYDAHNDAIIIADGGADTLYRASIQDGASEIIYRHQSGEGSPGLDGVTVTPDGTIYVAALSANAVMELAGGELVALAENFRGASDVEYHAGSLYVTNFDSRSLVLPGIQPQLPFALDVITLPET